MRAGSTFNNYLVDSWLAEIAAALSSSYMVPAKAVIDGDNGYDTYTTYWYPVPLVKN
jgi:hypothetical protein